MAIQFINYFLDDFNTEEINIENEDSIWSSAELRHIQNLNHSRIPNINYQTTSFCIGDQVKNYNHYKINLMKRS